MSSSKNEPERLHVDIHPGDDERLIRFFEICSGLVTHFRRGDSAGIMRSLHQLISLATGLSLSCELREQQGREEGRSEALPDN